MVRNKPAYLAIGVDVDGRKRVLGICLGDGDEGAKYWLAVLTEIRNRGTQDVLIVCCEGLKGLPDAIEATWPQSVVQTCVVHLLRGATRYPMLARQRRPRNAKGCDKRCVDMRLSRLNDKTVKRLNDKRVNDLTIRE